MAFFQLALKARRLEKARLLYQDEKMRSIEVSKGAKIHYTFFQKIRHKKILLKMRFRKWLKKVTSCPQDSWFHEKSVLLGADGTFENYILKSVIGFCGGIFLTYMFFMFFVFQLNFTLSSATLLCSIFGLILTIGLAFSYRVRCVVFLLLPQFFSKRGRQALMAYAFILALTGPAKNTLHNMGVLSESLACGQEQLKAAVRAIVDMIKQPFYALRDSMAKVMKSIRVVVKKIKEALLAIKRIVMSILKVFKAVFQWLGSLMNICNKKLGTPFDRCQKVFDGAVADCKASLGPLFGGICNLAYVVALLCWVVKPFDLICMLVSFITDSIVGAVKKKIKKFVTHVKAMFYVKVKFSHSFHFETNQSKSLEEIATGIVTEIRSRTDKFLTVFDWMSFATSFFFMFMMLRVIHYRHKWLTSERFDNRYLTNDLREIDLRRARLDKETVLPLNPREKNKYIPLTSILLIKAEKIKLTKTAVFLFLTTFKLGIHMMADYCLYWMLSTIRYHGRFESKVETPNSVGVYVSGNGFLADLYRSIVRAFSPQRAEIDMDTMPCLPDPIPPDLDRYTQIVSLIFFCWIMTIFEPYGLRLRHVVMCYYHPDRAKQRAVWLYNHIIRSRGSFLKFARRQLRRKFSKSDKSSIEKVTLKERVVAMCPIFRHCFGADKPMCLLCGEVERENQPPLIKCPKPLCTGLFCMQCFADLQNLCTICLEPIDYGDLSDMSEERDSSDGQTPMPCGQKLRDKLKEDALKRGEKRDEKEVIEEEEEAGKDGEEEEEEEEEDAGEEEDLLEECDDESDDEDDEDDDDEECDEEEGSTVKTVGEEDELDESESCSSSSTVYSYSYQDESPGEVDVTQQRVPYKDVEAQKIRDDVTIQVFNDPIREEESSSSDDLLDQRSRPPRTNKKYRKNLEAGKSTESPYDDYSTSSAASIADTESLPTEEIDEEEIIQEEISEDNEEEKLLSRKRKKRGKKRDRIKKIVTILSKPFIKKGCDRRCPGRGILKKKPSLFDKIVNMVQTKPKVHAECPRAVYRRLKKAELSSQPLTSVDSSTSEPEEVAESESSPKSILSSSHDLVEILSPRKKTPILSDKNLTALSRMEEIQHLGDSVSSGENLYSKSYDSHRERRKELKRRRTCKKRKGSRKKDTLPKYPHEQIFDTKQPPRYLKPVIEETKYDEINEWEIYGTPRSDKGKERMNKLSDSKTTSSASSVRNMWNIKSGDDDGCNICLCSRGSSLSSLDVPQCPMYKYELDMSTIEERSDEFSPRSRSEEKSLEIETTDEVVDVTGVSSATSGINVNKKDEYKEKKSIKRLVTPDEYTTDEDTLSSRWILKKARQEMIPATSEGKVQNIVEIAKPRKKKCDARSKSKKLKATRGEPNSEEQAENTTMIDGDEVELGKRRKRRTGIDRSASSGDKRQRKREAEEFGEGRERQTSIKLSEVHNEIKGKETAGSKEITKKDNSRNILKSFDFSGEKISTGGESLVKLKEVEALPKITSREVQTDFLKCRKKLRESRIARPVNLETFTSPTETEIEEYSRRNSKERAMPQRHRKSPRKYEKRCQKICESYYTDPEDSPQRRGHASHRSTFSDEEISPRRIFASEHRRQLPRNERECRNYYQEEIPRSPERRWSPKKWSPERYRDHSYPYRMDERDRRMVRDRDYRYQRDYHPAERPEGQLSPDYRLIRCPASGDCFEDRYIREYSPKREVDGYHNLRRNRDFEDRRYPRPEDGRQYVRNMFEPQYRRNYPYRVRRREPKEVYSPQRSVYDNLNYYQNYEQHGRSYGAETMNIPMYDPASPIACDVRNYPAEPATLRYPQRYPSPRTYPEGVDPYYGISSPTPNPYIPYNPPRPDQPSGNPPVEVMMNRPYAEEVDQYSGLQLPDSSCYVPCDQFHRQPAVPEDTFKGFKIPEKPIKDTIRRSFMNVPILRKFLPIFQKPELILELKEHDRIRLIQEREARERAAHEFTQTTQIPSPITTIQSEPSRDSSQVEALRPSNTSEDPRGNSEKRLPYQETEAFKEVVNEYEQRRSSKQQKRILSDRGSLNAASQQADASTDVTELYPPKDRRDTMCRIPGSFMNAFASKPQKSKSKKSSPGPSQRMKPCQNFKCTNKVRNTKSRQGQSLEDDPIEMSLVELNRSRMKNRHDQSETGEEDEEDTTDNNDTTREDISASIMPNLVERRKMKKQQFFGPPSQIYNIYYTESLPLAQLPGITQNLTKSFPQLSLQSAPNSAPRTRRNPKSSGLFRRNRYTPRETGLNDSLPYFPEEYQRQQIANLAMNQLKIRLPEFRESQNREVQNPQIQNPIMEYQKNALTNYRRSIDLASSSEEQYKKCRLGYQDLQGISNSPQGSPTSVTSSLDSCNRGMLNNSSQIITVPTQPMSSSQGYSMKIEVLAQPLKTDAKNPDKPEENFRDEYEATEFTRQKLVELPPNVLHPESNCVVPVRAEPAQSTKSILCTKKKKKMSIFTKIVRRIRRENSAEPGISVCETPQIYSGGNSKLDHPAEVAKIPVLSVIGLQNEGCSAPTPSLHNQNSSRINDGIKSNRNEVYVAQEILSPRQMISSTTNICSVKTEVQNTGPSDFNAKTISSGNKEANLSSEETGNVVPSFQDVMGKLEDTLAKYRFESDSERKLFTSMIMNKLKEHGIELSIYDQFISEMMEKEKRDQPSRNTVTPIEESSDKEPVDISESQKPPHIHDPKKRWNQNVPEPNMTSRFHASTFNETMDRSENQILPASPNTNSNAGSSASYICGNCRCKNPTSISGQDEDHSSLRKEVTKKNVHILKGADDDSYNWKSLYEHDVVQNNYLMYETNPVNMVSSCEDEYVKYQRWLKIQSRDRHPRSQENVDGGTSSRNLRSTENLVNSGRQGSWSHRHREREHSPPERDLSSRSLHENNRGYYASGNPSVSGLDHAYFDPDPESRQFPPSANLACCSLVMYGQNESAVSLTQGQCCHRTIPVCGTVSQGVSPRYQPNLVTSTHHDRDACCLRRNHHRARIQCHGHVHRTEEKRKRHRHYHISEFKGENEDDEDSVASPKGPTNSVISPPPVLRNLAKAANTVLTTIFGRSTDRPQNQEQQFQPHNREPRKPHSVVISCNRKRSTNDAMRRQHREEQGGRGHAVFNSQGN